MKFEPVVVGTRWRTAASPWIALLLAAPALFFLPITHDAIWQIWIGRQMLGGAELYRDIIEVNPPLWFWIAEPLAALGTDARLTIIGFFILATAAALYLIPERFRLPALAVMLILPLHDFGQREHFTLIATIPYVFAVASRTRGATPRHATAIGLFAAIGICLKPHFLFVPAALELLVLGWKHLRPETITLVIVGLIYALAIPVFAPAFLTNGLPMDLRFYGDFGERQNHALAFPLAFGAAGMLLGRRTGSAESRALFVAALAFIPAVLIQAKGFDYHSLPVRGLICLAILVELMRVRESAWADGLLISGAVLCCIPVGVYRNRFRSEVEMHLSAIPRGTTVIILSSNPSFIWPMVEEHGLRWQLHAISAWQLDAARIRPSLLPEIRRIYAADLAKRPELLIVDRRPTMGQLANQLLPPGYLRCYSLRLQTSRMASYSQTC